MIDFNSPSWHQLRRWAEQELAKSRLKLEALTLPETETAAIRGEIRLLKRLLDLPQAAARGVAVEPDE